MFDIALSMLLPVFFIILPGWVLRGWYLLTEGFFEGLNTPVFYNRPERFPVYEDFLVRSAGRIRSARIMGYAGGCSYCYGGGLSGGRVYEA